MERSSKKKSVLLEFPFIVFGLMLAVQVHAQRIVTAGSSSTEIVCRLGLCDNIIATDRTSLYPLKMQSLPSIGYRSGISAEGVISLNPDVIILEKGYVKQVVVEQLQETGKKLVIVENNSNLKNTWQRIRTIAGALNKKQEGEALIAAMQTKLEALVKRVEASEERPRVLCVYARGAGSLQVAGSKTGFMSIELAGIQNAVPEIEGYKPLNTEALIKANPDYLLFFKSGLKSLGGIEGALKIPGLTQTTAGRQKQILAVDGVKLTNWGPRLPDVVLELFEMTHPGQ